MEVCYRVSAEEQVALTRQLADSRSDFAITHHLRSNRGCLIAVCSHVFDLFSVVARARNILFTLTF